MSISSAQQLQRAVQKFETAVNNCLHEMRPDSSPIRHSWRKPSRGNFFSESPITQSENNQPEITSLVR